jgi:hypothetical protein
MSRSCSTKTIICYFFFLFLFPSLLTSLSVSTKEEISQQPPSTYAIGLAASNYPGFEPYFFPAADVFNFINYYNNLGGLPSLGVFVEDNCLFNVKWAGEEQFSCRCPFSSTIGTIETVVNSSPGHTCTNFISSSNQILPIQVLSQRFCVSTFHLFHFFFVS